MKLEKHLHFEQIGSTNTWAKQHVEEWAIQGLTCVTASCQTAGRGRFTRRWESPADVNLYATFCFWMDQRRTDLGHLPLLLALATAQILEEQDFKPQIKWPNDLLLFGKKVAGILCETVGWENKEGIICGIGLNVNMSVEALNQIDRPATSLHVESGQLFDVKNLLEQLQSRFSSFLHLFLQKGFSPFFPLLQARFAFNKGQKVRFHHHREVVEAEFEALQPDGSLVLRFPEGITRIYYSGELLN